MRRHMRIAVMVVGVAMLATACSTGSAPDASVVPVVIDYSPTVSDVGALIYLLSEPEVDVIAVTLPATGEAGCETGLEVTLGILAMFDRNDIPVACDPTIPAHANEWPQAFIGGNDALALALPDAVSEPDPRPTTQLIAEVVAAAENPVVLFAVAPLTNVANALDHDPSLVENLEQIVIMGGAVDAPGNVSGTGAEWNVWIDVPAAAAVISSGAAVTLVPLDATNDVPTPGLWELDIRELPTSPPTEYLAAMLAVFPTATSGSFYLWDELAAGVAAGHTLTTNETITITVVEEAGPDFGKTTRDPEGRPITVAFSVPDPAAFYRHFLTTIAGEPVDPRSILSVSRPEDVAIGPEASPESILAFWVMAALAGDTARATEVVTSDAGWPGIAAGLAESPDVFVAGSGPYGAFNINLTCSAAAELALCDGTWNDKWLSANPEIDQGRIRVKAAIADGRIHDFEEVSFNTEIGAAFDSHLSWLATAYPDRLQDSCGTDGASVACSDLLVSTAAEWVAER